MWRYVLIVLLLGVAGGLYWLFGDHAYYFRYRLTVDIEADGKVHSASSVIEVRYWWTTFSSGSKGWAARVDAGIAPMIDLGRYGTVITALWADTTDDRLYTSIQARRLPPGVPVGLAGLPWKAYNLNQRPVMGTREKVVMTKDFPDFVWTPPNNNWRESMQLLPDEFEATIGRGVRLIEVSIETAPNATPFEVQKPLPNWIRDLCRHNAQAKTLPIRAMELPGRIGQRFLRLPFKYETICDLVKE